MTAPLTKNSTDETLPAVVALMVRGSDARGPQVYAAGVRTRKEITLECLDFIRALQETGTPQIRVTDLPSRILSEGAELIGLGFKTERIQIILDERIHQAFERAAKVSNSIRSLAKYPPAFGLVGTVLGLVSLMRAVSDGAGASETGTRMAVALTATLYGLLTANLFVAPAGEKVLALAGEEKTSAELALQAVLLASDRVTLVESQEMLNSFLDDQERISVQGAGARSAA
jgi:chemotaxis protein MotA